MSNEVGRLESDMLFLALTRPAVILGVTYSWFTLEAMGWLLFFINTSDFITVILGAVCTHLVGTLIIAKEPRFMEMVKVWAVTNTKCRNKRYHGNTDSYDLY